MSAEPLPERDELECELVELIDAHASERAALRVTYEKLKIVLADADRAVSKGFIQGVFSEGARPPREAI
ncbi:MULTISPECIES: hypothetical protein [unclassified Bosea (in: a-proteobacteria)]|uniref:hypothetical protein n=1 Tax=unclassified Bosea (in: a-proteobacteria) TaxID=2653178 RepID=UPI000F7525E2|nr:MULTISPECIES: hypothetical protein [unclassified Bosea (in: a-proteobacteria)]AZO82176.1 hypothetical protein BLM15_30850 [Bosea sp. Tri-49]